LPTGQPLYARLWTNVNNTWLFSDRSFIADTSPPCKAILTQPASGTPTVDLTSGFAWTSVPNVTAYYLYVGTSAGANNLVNSGETQSAAFVATDLPLGQTLYVRLWTETGSWRYNDYT